MVTTVVAMLQAVADENGAKMDRTTTNQSGPHKIITQKSLQSKVKMKTIEFAGEAVPFDVKGGDVAVEHVKLAVNYQAKLEVVAIVNTDIEEEYFACCTLL
eukprot:TRINITY_DN10952_c0_g1_i1.p6 TRINITY_DN10952_c0_g1~~TRINITY_DN10952_c0_g1_i1.p6  ORF type:complete len:101 (+),score=31.79 TRINITY_DN10952_c0_g1_i1:2732-3034(+)